MKRFNEQLKKQAESLKLRKDERSDLRERLVAYMDYHPLPENMKGAVPQVKSKRFHTLNINAWLVGRMAGAFAILFLIVVPVAAENSVPGDALYPIKVKFNEEVRGSLTFSPYQKVEWETARLERRIAEARLLADEGKLTPEVESEVAIAVKRHSDAAKEEIESIRESDSDEASIAEINFTSALEVQSEVLEGHLERNSEASDSTDGVSIAALAGAVNEARDGVTPREMSSESYEKLLARIETETTRAYEYFNKIDDVASADEKRNIERRLGGIKAKVEIATEEDKERAAAVALLSSALSDTRKLISFITNIDVRANVSIDELVPLTLTKEERITILDQQISDTEALTALAKEHLAALEAAGSPYAGASLSLEFIEASLVLSRESLAENKLVAAENAAVDAFTEARHLEKETRKLVEALPVEDIATSTDS